MLKKSIVLTLFFIAFSACSHKAPDQNLPLTPTSLETPVPVPDYIMTLGPAPGEHYTLSEYEDLAPSFGWGSDVPGICVSVTPVLLLEPGDFPTAEEWLSRMYIIVDGKTITEPHSVLKTDTIGLGHQDPDTGKYVYKAPDGSPFGICYEVALEVGRHTATVVISKTSGTLVFFSWPFYIVE